jgi:hypothetical protein
MDLVRHSICAGCRTGSPTDPVSDAGEALAQRVPLEQLRHDERLAVVPDVVDAHAATPRDVYPIDGSGYPIG